MEGRGDSSGDVSEIGCRGIFGLVDWKPCGDCTMCPLFVSSTNGQYAVALSRGSTGQVR